MAEFRSFHTRFWKDSWVSELNKDEKFLFIYLFTNDRASICGMYELPLRYIVFETGIEKEQVVEILKKFEADKKVFYRDGIVWVVNLRKYNETRSEKVLARIVKDLNEIPDCELKKMYYQYHKSGGGYGIDTLSRDDSLNGNGYGNGYGNGNGNETSAALPTYPVSPEIELYHEVTGLYPNFMDEEKVKLNIQSLREKMCHPPREEIKKLMVEKYNLWKSQRTKDGRLYNPSRIDWIEWCITGYTPPPASPQPPKPTAQEQRAAELEKARERYEAA